MSTNGDTDPWEDDEFNDEEEWQSECELCGKSDCKGTCDEEDWDNAIDASMDEDDEDDY